MIEEIFWYMGMKHQYKLQKEQGAAGLFALIATAFVIWQWDNIFFPILKKTGLVEVAEIGGLIDHSGSALTGLQTFVNIAAFILFILLCIGILSAIPMALFLLAISFTSAKGNIFIMVLGLCLLPLAIIALPIIWLGKKTKVVSETNDINTYVKNNPVLGNENMKLKGMPYVPKNEYLGVYARQETFFRNNPTQSKEMSLEEATTYLNHCVKDFQSDVRVLFGYKQERDAWFVLYPSPVPQFATSTLHDVAKNNTGGSEDPLRFKVLSTRYAMHMERLDIYKNGMTNDFFVPAELCEVYYEPFKKRMELVQNHNVSTLINLAELDYIYLMDGATTKQLSSTAVKMNTLLTDCMKNAIGLSYYLPLMYFNVEMSRYKNNDPGSYYRALQKVDGAYENFPNHQESFIKVAERMATNSHFKDGTRIYNDILANKFNQL